MDGESDEIVKLARCDVGSYTEAYTRVNKRPKKTISTLIPSRQAPKLSLWKVRKVIKGRSKPTVEIFMED